MTKVLILTGDAVETHELFYPFWRLKEAEIEVTVAAPTKKEVLFTVVHDFEPGWETVSEKPGYRFLLVDAAFKDIKPEEYDGLILPGGRAPEYIRMSPDLEPIIRHFFDADKPIAAMCHGVLLIAKFGLAKGRKMTAFSIISPDLKQAGAIYCDQEVAIDGNLVTSRTYFDLPVFMREFLKLLRRRSKSDDPE
jgi:protease I